MCIWLQPPLWVNKREQQKVEGKAAVSALRMPVSEVRVAPPLETAAASENVLEDKVRAEPLLSP